MKLAIQLCYAAINNTKSTHTQGGSARARPNPATYEIKSKGIENAEYWLIDMPQQDGRMSRQTTGFVAFTSAATPASIVEAIDQYRPTEEGPFDRSLQGNPQSDPPRQDQPTPRPTDYLYDLPTRVTAVAGDEARQEIQIDNGTESQQDQPEGEHGGGDDHDSCYDKDFTHDRSAGLPRAQRQAGII